MSIDLESIKTLAPDQASLTAAGKLLNPKHWSALAQDAALEVIWGECQGSGANPYRVVFGLNDHGYKCSCPSRKFPCKHALALMMRFAQDEAAFLKSGAPEWVQEWLGRRKRSPSDAQSAANSSNSTSSDKDIAQAFADTGQTTKFTVEEQQRRDKAAQTRQLQTRRDVSAGLEELRGWIGDQLRGGIASFVDCAPERCRRIAARLVDAKAAGLASRIDELPARLLGLPASQRTDGALFELGQIVLLSQAWQANPDDTDASGAVRHGPSRETLLSITNAPRVRSCWEVVAEQVQTRRDGLVSQITWLLDIDSETPRFACLLDFFPASGGRRSSAFSMGQRLHAELLFYPSRAPMRAIIAQHLAAPEDLQTRPVKTQPSADPLSRWHHLLERLPWAPSIPLLLGAGRLQRAPDGQLWWSAIDECTHLPLSPLKQPDLLLATPLDNAVLIWDGLQAQLLRTNTLLGTCYLHG